MFVVESRLECLILPPTGYQQNDDENESRNTLKTSSCEIQTLNDVAQLSQHSNSLVRLVSIHSTIRIWPSHPLARTQSAKTDVGVGAVA